MSQDVVKEFIEHHGVKGMKWGKRSARTPRRESSDFKKTAPLRNRKSHELTNRQLKVANERINLEQNYSRLNPTKVQKGRAVATSVLATAGMGVAAYNLYNSPAGKAAIAAGKAIVDKKLKG